MERVSGLCRFSAAGAGAVQVRDDIHLGHEHAQNRVRMQKQLFG
jgi:hypothetical protein